MKQLGVVLAFVAAAIAVSGGAWRFFRAGEFDIVPFAMGAVLLGLGFYLRMQATEV